MQKKKLLVAYFGDTPESVEGFPKDCRRSCEGSLMFKRGKKKTITDDEYKFICESKNYSHMRTKLRLIAEKVDKPEPKKKDESKEKESSKKEVDKKTQSGKSSTSSTGKKAVSGKKTRR